MPDYTISLTDQQNFILVNALARYNTSRASEEGFIPLTLLQFIQRIVDEELLNRKNDVGSEYRQIISLLRILPSQSRTDVLSSLPARIRNYLQTL